MLQGSLEKFALDEVLGLLSGTSKTGHLEIAGDRGEGSLSFSNGKLVDAKVSNARNGQHLEDVMFELLRFKSGTFNFDSRAVDPADESASVDAVLVAAEERLSEWNQIEAVVPSLAHMITPAAELPAEEVTISRTDWAALTTIAAGCPVSVVCDELELGEVEGSRLVKGLVERQLLSVGAPSTGRPQAEWLQTSAAESSYASLADLDSEDSDQVEQSQVEQSQVEQSQVEQRQVEQRQVEQSQVEQEVQQERPARVWPVVESDRPPMPPMPGSLDPLGTDDTALDSLIPPPPPPPSAPPAPPSPAEISEFEVNDVSELVDDEVEEDGGLLMQYLSSEE